MSKASDIAQRLCDRLGAVAVASGFATDAGANVFRGATNIPKDRMPALVLMEGEEDVLEQKSDGVCRARVPYSIEGHIACDPDNPNDAAHALISDVLRAIFAPGMCIDGMTTDMAYAGRAIQPRADGTNIVMVTVKLVAQYKLNVADPAA